MCKRSGEEAPDAEANEKDDERCVRNPCGGHGGGAIVEGAPCILGKGVAVIGSGFFVSTARARAAGTGRGTQLTKLRNDDLRLAGVDVNRTG